MLAGTVIKKSCSSIGPIWQGRAYYALRKLSIPGAILLDANTRKLLSTTSKSASACVSFIDTNGQCWKHVSHKYYIIVKSNNVVLTALREWDNQGHPSLLKH